MRRSALLAAVAALVAALVGASTAHASKFIQKGIYDDAQILYGNPDKVFPVLQQIGTQVIRVNLWWGGPNGVARRRPTNASNPADPAYDWSTYDRTVRYANAYKMAPIFTVIGTPAWANASAGWNAAPSSPADLKAFVTAAARRYSGKYKLPDGTTNVRVSKWIAWNEPNNPVFMKPQFVRSGGYVGRPERDRLREDLQRSRGRSEVGECDEQGRVRCHVTARQQPARHEPHVDVAARVSPGDEEGGREGLRRLRPPSVLRLSVRDADHQAAPREAWATADGRDARQLRRLDEGARTRCTATCASG